MFHEGVLPAPPSVLSTDRIVIKKTTSDYNSWYRADRLVMYLNSRTCRELGVFLLACGLHGPRETVTLTLSHSDSEIRRIVVSANRYHLGDLPSGLLMNPFALDYFVAETAEFPWLHVRSLQDLPRFALTNAADSSATDDDWRNRDTVLIAGFGPGEFRFAELLLNAGCAWNSVREYTLEGDAGYRGVAPMSAELQICLPGRLGWIYAADEIPSADAGS